MQRLHKKVVNSLQMTEGVIMRRFMWRPKLLANEITKSQNIEYFYFELENIFLKPWNHWQTILSHLLAIWKPDKLLQGWTRCQAVSLTMCRKGKDHQQKTFDWGSYFSLVRSSFVDAMQRLNQENRHGGLRVNTTMNKRLKRPKKWTKAAETWVQIPDSALKLWATTSRSISLFLTYPNQELRRWLPHPPFDPYNNAAVICTDG